MDSLGLNRLEELCLIVYGGKQSSQLVIDDAHKVLLALQTRAAFLPQITFLLSNAKTPYSLLYAINSILAIVQKDWDHISEQKQKEIRPMLLNFLVTTRDSSAMFIVNAAIRCYCRIVKEGWAAKKNFQDLFGEIQKLLDSSNEKDCVLGLQILSNLVVEFDVTNSEHTSSKTSSSSYAYRVVTRYDAKRRLLSQAFREQALSKIFIFSLRFVERGKGSGSPVLLKEALVTLLTCLKFDFVGTGQQSSDESVNCLYIPMDWADKIARDKGLLQLFEIYTFIWNQINNGSMNQKAVDMLRLSASCCLEMLTLLVSARRSAFTSQTRRAFLVVLITETTKIMSSKIGLDKSEDCLHHFCRLLAAIKNHFTLVDLTQPEEYHTWLRQLTSFTTEILQAWNTVSNRTVHYIVKLWASLVLPTPYLQARDGFPRNSHQPPVYLRGLSEYVPQVVKSFIVTRCELCSSSDMGVSNANFSGNAMFSGDDDFLGEEGLLLDTLAPVSVLSRFRFTQTLSEVQKLYTEALTAYNGFLSNLGNLNQEASKLFLSCQSRLTFLNYLIGTIIGSHVTKVSAAVIENFDQTNLELASLVFSLIHSMNQTNASSLDLALDTAFRLEMSCLYFVRSFQNLYIEARARLDADREKYDQSDIGYGMQYPNAMYEAIRGIRGQGQRRTGMDEDDDQSSRGERRLQQLQDDINKRFGASVLDMALQKVFMILSHMSSGNQDQTVLEESNRVVLIEKALGVLHELSIGVTVIHAGRSFAPKLMSSGKLLLESKTIQGLLISPEARNFPLLTEPVHFKSRSFLMATLAKLLFTQLRNIPSNGVTLDMGSFEGLGFDLEKLFTEINRIIFNNSSSMNNLKTTSSSVERLRMNEDAEVVIVSGDGIITINRPGSSLLALHNGSRQPNSDLPIYSENFYQRREISRAEVSDILFVQFMKPLDLGFQKIASFFNQPTQNPSMIEDIRKSILIFFKDIKGILSSCAIAREYELLFSWFFPGKAKIMALIGQLFWNDDAIMACMFKFLRDLVHNRGSRINFGSSFNAGNIAGTMLFKEACTVILCYVKPKLKQIEGIMRNHVQQKEQRVKRVLGNDNILKDLSIITGVKEASKSLGIMDSSAQKDGFLSLNALKEAVMNIDSSTSSTFALNDSRRKIGSANSNSLKLDFRSYGVGVTLDLKEITESNPNSRLVKIISSVTLVLCRILYGRFANISCFKIYNDSTLRSTISVALELIFVAEPYQIVSFPKMANTIIELLHVLCGNAKFLLFVVENNPGLLARIFGTLAEVINLEEYYESSNLGKKVSLEEVATDIAQDTGTQDTNKQKYSQYRGIVGKAAVALHNLVELRCRSVAFRYVKSSSSQQGNTPEAVFNTKLSFLSLELRNILDPEYRPSLSSNVHNNQAFTHEMLAVTSEFFRALDKEMPNLFSELLILILSKLFTLSASREDAEPSEKDTRTKPTQRSYAARSNAKKIARTLLPLILTTPHTFEQFKQRILAIHSNNSTKQGIIEGRFSRLFKVLEPAITSGNGNTIGPNPAFFEALLRHNDSFANEVCKLADELNQ